MDRRYTMTLRHVATLIAFLCASMGAGKSPKTIPPRVDPRPPLESAPSPTTQPLIAPPDAPAQFKAEKTIKEVFAKDYALKAPIDRQILASKLLQHALDTSDDPAARFVLLREARELAAGAADAATASRAIVSLGKFYTIQPLPMVYPALLTAQQNATSPDALVAISHVALQWVETAILADDYPIASRLTGLASLCAEKAKNLNLVELARGKAREVQDTYLESEGLKKARDRLSQWPDDGDANLQIGRFLCVVKSDFDAGLPMLAKGSDMKLRALAKDDLALSADPLKALSLGNAWWEYSLGQSPLNRKHVQARAAIFYRRALPMLSGLNRSAAEKRLAEHDAQVLRDQNMEPGLAAYLFKGIELLHFVKTRTDAQLNFDWGEDAPDSDLPKDNFSFRWVGAIKPPVGGRYEITLIANAGAKLWLDERLILDRPDLGRHRNGEKLNLDLSAAPHSLRIDYWDTGGIARIKLLWRPPGMVKEEPIPASAFYHDSTLGPAIKVAP